MEPDIETPKNPFVIKFEIKLIYNVQRNFYAAYAITCILFLMNK